MLCKSIIALFCAFEAFSQHLQVRFLFLVLYPKRRLLCSPALSHTHTNTDRSDTPTQFCDSQCCHTSSFAQNFVTHHLSHTALSHTITIFYTQLTLSHTISVAGVAFAQINLGFAWQVWHLWLWAGSGGGLGRRWTPVTPRHFP